MTVEETLQNATPCKKCKCKPILDSSAGDLFYTKCSNPACGMWSPYEFVGITPKASIQNWNDGNKNNAKNKLFVR